MNRSERVETIDALRGVAALAVVLFHYVGVIPALKIPVGPVGAAVVAATRPGHLGVPIFFVLSGYVIALTASRYDFTPGVGGRFVLRRFVRLAPPYWAMVAISAGTIVAGHAVGLFRNTTLTPAQVAAHLLYAQNLLGFRALDVAYWTLCLEVQFYLVFALSAVAFRRLPPGALLAWFTALTVGSAAIDVLGAVPQAWFPRLWYQFGVGVLTYHAGRSRPARGVLLVLLPALMVLGLWRGRAADGTVAAVSALLLATARLADRAPAPPSVLLGLGRISYSLYLVHGFVGLSLATALKTSLARSEAVVWAAIATVTAASIAFAAAFYRLCELRGVEWSRRVRIVPPPSSPARPAADRPPQPSPVAEPAG